MALPDQVSLYTAKQMVGNYKAANEPPDWCDAEAIAVSLLSGQLSIPDLAKLYSYPDRVAFIKNLQSRL